MAGKILGQYVGKVGEKGRIAFPKKFKEALGDNLIITFGYENSLIIVSEEGWEALLEGTAGRPFIEADTRFIGNIKCPPGESSRVSRNYHLTGWCGLATWPWPRW